MNVNAQEPDDICEPQVLEQFIATYRCCGAPSLCGVSCMDDEGSYVAAVLVREIDRLRGGVA